MKTIQRRLKEGGTVNIIQQARRYLNMGDIDEIDQYASSYCFIKESCK